MSSKAFHFFAAALLTSTTLVGAFVACSSERKSGFDDNGDGAFGDGAANFGQGDGEAGACLGGCSGDLHSLLDCNGSVIMTCPPDQGCAAGKCLPACEAAAANKSSVGCDYLVYPPPFFSGST